MKERDKGSLPALSAAMLSVVPQVALTGHSGKVTAARFVAGDSSLVVRLDIL